MSTETTCPEGPIQVISMLNAATSPRACAAADWRKHALPQQGLDERREIRSGLSGWNPVPLRDGLAGLPGGAAVLDALPPDARRRGEGIPPAAAAAEIQQHASVPGDRGPNVPAGQQAAVSGQGFWKMEMHFSA
jgi:hypothetical protein